MLLNSMPRWLPRSTRNELCNLNDRIKLHSSKYNKVKRFPVLLKRYRKEFCRPPNPEAQHLRCIAYLMDRTHNGRPIKILTVIDEYSRQWLAIVVDGKMGTMRVSMVN